MRDDAFTWGKSDDRGAQGWAIRDGAYWTASWSAVWDTLERGGAKYYDGSAWVSSWSLDYPYAVTDDFGTLVPVNAC